jgi:hypothetical protein
VGRGHDKSDKDAATRCNRRRRFFGLESKQTKTVAGLEFNMPRKKPVDRVPRLIVPKNATLKQIYAIARKQFSAADLLDHIERKDSKPLDTAKLLKELEEIHESTLSKRKSRR